MIPDTDNNETNDFPNEPAASAGSQAEQSNAPGSETTEHAPMAAPASEPAQESTPAAEAPVHHADEDDEEELVDDELFDNDFDEDFDDGAPLADEYRPDEDDEEMEEEDLDEEDLEEEAEDQELSDAADDILAPEPAGIDEPAAAGDEPSTGAIAPVASKLPGTLLFVGTPIGNKEDITYRGHRALQNADVVVCEEYKVGARLLRDLNISKKLIEMNEHNEEEASEEIIGLLRHGKKIAVISDAGLPLIADPGSILMRKVLALGGQPVVIPGVSSIMTALMMSGFDLRTFDYVGFLPRKPEERQAALHDLASRPRTLVLLETPYRLRSLLAGLVAEMPDRQATLAVNLTTPFEAVVRGTLQEIADRFAERKFKGEFVMVLAPTFTRTERKAAAPRDVAETGDETAGGYAPVRMRPAREHEERDARPQKFGRREFGERPGRESGEIRRSPGREERGERPAWKERSERGGRPGRGERPGSGGPSRFEGRGGGSRFERGGGSSRFEGRGGSSRFERGGRTERPRFEERGDAERPRFEGRGGTDRPSRGDWTPRRSSHQGGRERGNDEFRGGGFRGGEGRGGERRGGEGRGGEGRGGEGRGGEFRGGGFRGGEGRGGRDFGGRGFSGRGPGRPGRPGHGGPRGGSGKGGRRPR